MHMPIHHNPLYTWMLNLFYRIGSEWFFKKTVQTDSTKRIIIKFLKFKTIAINKKNLSNEMKIKTRTTSCLRSKASK